MNTRLRSPLRIQTIRSPWTSCSIKIAPSTGAGDLSGRVAEEVKRLTNLRPTVEIVARDEIYDPTAPAKPKRIVDLRQAR